MNLYFQYFFKPNIDITHKPNEIFIYFEFL